MLSALCDRAMLEDSGYAVKRETSFSLHKLVETLWKMYPRRNEGWNDSVLSNILYNETLTIHKVALRRADKTMLQLL